MVQINIVGNATNDAEIKSINGKQLISFSLAHNEKFKNAQGVQQEKTYYFRCSYWSESTALAQYIKKGQQVFVSGNQVTANGYANAQGQISASIELRVTLVQLLGNKSKETPKSSQNEGVSDNGGIVPDNTTENLPF